MARELRNIKVADVSDDAFRLRADIEGEAFDELVKSVRRVGVLVPVLVRKRGDSFCVIAGHRRFCAARAVGFEFIPAQIVSGEESMEWEGAFAENLFRTDLTPVEEAAGIHDLLKEPDYDLDRVCRCVGRSRGWVEGRLELLNWAPEVLEAIQRGLISCSAARNLAAIGDEAQRNLLLQYAVESGVTARVTSAWLQSYKASVEVRDPGATVPVDDRERVGPIEPYTPCVVCSRQMKMVELSYLPVCRDCSHQFVQAVRQAGGVGGG